jgi:membrane-associated phospholipid phosphatase
MPPKVRFGSIAPLAAGLIALALPTPSFAQAEVTHGQAQAIETAANADQDGTPHPMLNGRYYENFARAPYEFLTSPFDWDAREWGIAALAVGGFVGLMFADRPLRDFWQDTVRSGATDDVAKLGADLDPLTVMLPLTGAATVLSAATGDRQLQVATMESLQSLAISIGLFEGIKLLAHRERPNESPNDAFRFDGPGTDGSNKSLPSGHAAGAFAVATSFALNYPDDDFVAPTAYTLAGLVSWSRLNDNKHWTTDVLLGAGLGYAMSLTVHRLNPFGNPKSPVTARPYLDGDSQGVQVTVKF